MLLPLPPPQVQDGLCACTSSEALSQIQLWDVRSGSAGWRSLQNLGDASMLCCNSMSFERPLGMLVGGCGDKSMRVWDLET